MLQGEFRFRSWGGHRAGAGRPRKRVGRGMSHLARPVLPRRYPVHVTLRMLPDVWSLRSQRCFKVIAHAFWACKERVGLRLNHFSVQGNHLHLIVEAEDRQALARGVQGIAIRMAIGIDRVMERRGRVFSDRYHSHILRTPTEVRRALRYVRENHVKHAREVGRAVSQTSVDPYSSERRAGLVVVARTWLLAEGWRRGAG